MRMSFISPNNCLHFPWPIFLLIFIAIGGNVVGVDNEDFTIIKLDEKMVDFEKIVLGPILAGMECKMNFDDSDASTQIIMEFCVPKDQIGKCMQNPDESSTFIFCYSAKLTEGKVNEQFMIENTPVGGMLAEKCANVIKKGNSAEKFHAIQLKPIKLIGDILHLELSTSFSTKKYKIVVFTSEINACSAFPLVPSFGEHESDNDELYAEDISTVMRKEAREAMEKMPNGEILAKHAGLWLWAMDMAHPFGDKGGETMGAVVDQGKCSIKMRIFMAFTNGQNFTKCHSYWAQVIPARVDLNLTKMGDNPGSIITEYVLRAGYVQKSAEKNKSGERMLIEEYVKGALKMTTGLMLNCDNRESKKWFAKVENALWNVPFGEYFYAKIANKWATENGGPGVEMLMHECGEEGQNDIFGSAIRPNEGSTPPEEGSTFDWKDDFGHLNGCMHEIEDLSSKLPKSQISVSLGSAAPEHKVDFIVGVVSKNNDENDGLGPKLTKEQKITLKFFHQQIQQKEYFGQTIVDESKIFNAYWILKLEAKFRQMNKNIMKNLTGKLEESSESWETLVGEFGIFQEKYICPAFSVFLPQVSGRIKFVYYDSKGNPHFGFHGYSSKTPGINFIDSFAIKTSFGAAKCSFKEVYVHKEKNIFGKNEESQKCQL